MSTIIDRRKNKRLFYYHEGVDVFVPLESKEYLEFYLDDLNDEETFDVTFKRKDMTDEEFENLEEI